VYKIHGYRYTIDYIEEINAALKVVITERLSGNLVLRRDQFNDRTVENTVGLTYKQQCWGVGVDYSKTYDDQRIMFKLSLAGLGLFGMQ
jgi:lipopolysaccharide assembly outer membrane protein LptD (OstA)